MKLVIFVIFALLAVCLAIPFDPIGGAVGGVAAFGGGAIGKKQFRIKNESSSKCNMV